jgi:hypothetical protein
MPRVYQTPVPSTMLVTFVIRFWHETTTGNLGWRGRIEHVQSGKSAAFLDLKGMVSFLHQFGVDMDMSFCSNQIED